MTQHEERRQKRSHDPVIALHYQLVQARNRGLADAVVVADSAGLVVAGAGPWAACEELAAYAPLLAGGGAELSAPPRILALLAETAVTAVEVDDQRVLVCVRGGRERAASLEVAAFGVARILKAA